MRENSKIEWCDHTFNPWRGCTKVSPGCANCYAEALSKRNPAVLGQWGPGKPRVLASEAAWREPLRWAKVARETGRRPRVFCASLADWLDEEVPIEWLARLLELIYKTPELDWLLLTKRPQNWGVRVLAACIHMAGYRDGKMGDGPTEKEMEGGQMVWDWGKEGRTPANVWIGTTVEDQQRADERIPLLLKIPADVHFLSCEPLLGPLDLDPFLGRSVFVKRCPLCLYFTNRGSEDVCPNDGAKLTADIGIDWVICGGESGPGARPMHPDWARGLRDQCVAAKVPFFFKQWGDWEPGGDPDRYVCHAGYGEKSWQSWMRDDGEEGQCQIFDDDGTWINHSGDPGEDMERIEIFNRVGKKAAGRVLDGRTWDESPRYEVK